MNILEEICHKNLVEKGLEKYEKRLKQELRQIDAQDKHDYFLDLYTRNARFAYNEHNLLIVYLLGLANDFDINNTFAYVNGENPDIDIDYIDIAKDYLKNVWARKVFGEECVSSIGTYAALGIKQAILDTVKVYGQDKAEIQAITVKMHDKDNEGLQLTWDDALEEYSEFKEYCESNPEIAEVAKLLVGKNKSRGVHPGGLIIASSPISQFVPLEMTKDGIIVTAWGEGLKSQDLQTVGLVKFDILSIANIMQIALAGKLVKERHGLKRICSLDDEQKDWSDLAYLNDPKCMEMANKGDLKCIFQFDSDGIRKLAKRGGVSKFEDLEALNALYRPGPIRSLLTESYIKRKRGEEPYEVHLLLSPILGNTYGTIVYQEQIVLVLNKVGLIPMKNCVTLLKAISKKQVGKFQKYKEQFVENGQKTLEWTKEKVEEMWGQIEKFAKYSFNKSHSTAYTYVALRLLWLKAYYPLEFYAALLTVEDKDDKLKEYKRDAKAHGIEIQPLNLNKSGVDFDIVDEQIYYGFHKIKGIGKETAKDIVKGQPYKDFEDFLHRFGTKADAVKALVALGCFGDDRVNLMKFYEYYKDFNTKHKQKDQRFVKRMEKYDLEIKEIADTSFDEHEKWPEFQEKVLVKNKEVSKYDLLIKLKEKRDASIEKNKNKSIFPKMIDFIPEDYTLNPEVEELMSCNPEVAQEQYYGFVWDHSIEKSPDYQGFTISNFLVEELVYGPIEIQIKNINRKTSKNDNIFYSITGEDADGEECRITMWSDDYDRFKDNLKKNNFVRMQVKPPSGGFPSFLFFSYPRHEKWKLPPKDEDYRLMALRCVL